MEEKKISPFSKGEFVKQFEELILHGLVLPGERLPSERELAERFGVSRPMVHEGLLSLCAKGLITMRPRHGCLVNNVQKEGAFNMLDSLYSFDSGTFSSEIDSGLEELRLMILEKAAKACCEKIADFSAKTEEKKHTHTADYDSYIKKLRHAAFIDPAQNAEKKAALDFEFYRLLIEFALNKVFLLLYNSGKSLYERKLTDFFTGYPAATQKTNELKSRLVEQIAKSNSAQACFVIRDLVMYKTYEV